MIVDSKAYRLVKFRVAQFERHADELEQLPPAPPHLAEQRRDELSNLRNVIAELRGHMRAYLARFEGREVK